MGNRPSLDCVNGKVSEFVYYSLEPGHLGTDDIPPIFERKESYAQTSSSTLEFTPTRDFPALQYLDRVDKGSPADKAGLKPGDFLLEINNENVMNATHEHTVRLIKNSHDTLAMKVITVAPLNSAGMDPHMDGTRTLPIKPHRGNRKSTEIPATVGPAGSKPLSGTAARNNAAMIEGLAELDEESVVDDDYYGHYYPLEKLDHTLAQYDSEPDRYSLNSSAEYRGVDPNNKTASIRRTTKRLTAVNLDEMFVSAPTPPQRSVAQLTPQPKYVTQVELEEPEERIYAVPYKGHPNGSSPIPPPPLEPAPTPPVQENSGNSSCGSEVIAINTKKQNQYANVSSEIAAQRASANSPYESSFRPGVVARMSKDPASGPPRQHSRQSSLSSTVSSLSEHSAVRTTPSQPEERRSKPYYEPEPDYEETDLSTPVPAPSQQRKQAPPPPSEYKEPTKAPPVSSAAQFSAAIKEAADAREHKSKAPPAPPPPPPPPGAPPPPPPPGIVQQQHRESEPRKIPPHVQKSLAEKQKKDDAHAALMAAVAKRRNIVENADMDRVADSIETRIHKTKKLQTTVYKSNNTKVDITPEPVTSPAPLLDNGSTDNKSNVSSPKTDEPEGMLAKAERLRQDYLRMKGMNTLEKKKEEKKDDHPSPSLSVNSKSNQNGGTSYSVSPATVSQQAAIKAQKSTGQLENNNNNNTKTYKAHTPTTHLSIDGATVESSHTESLRRSVADKARLFGDVNRVSPPRQPPPPPPTKSRAFPTNSSSVHSNGDMELSVADIDVDFIPPPPVFDYVEDSTSVASSTGTVSSHGDNGSHGSSSPKFMFNVPPVQEEEFVLPPIAPPPPGFDDDEGGVDSTPPPVNDFTKSNVTSLRSVVRSSPNSSSLSFPAKTRPYQSQPVARWTVADVGEWLESIQLAEHRSCFQRQGVNGQKLLQLGRTELIALGVTQIHHRMNIEKALKKANKK